MNPRSTRGHVPLFHVRRPAFTGKHGSCPHPPDHTYLHFHLRPYIVALFTLERLSTIRLETSHLLSYHHHQHRRVTASRLPSLDT
ncbi:hypothetical protein C8R48DRAFT_731120 [Suillus tomentosus]|nr:hypothetical protein C8R48DRAFT_731120 [Suillus tomentosus]